VLAQADKSEKNTKMAEMPKCGKRQTSEIIFSNFHSVGNFWDIFEESEPYLLAKYTEYFSFLRVSLCVCNSTARKEERNMFQAMIAVGHGLY